MISRLGHDCLLDPKPMLTSSHDPTAMQVILPLFLFSVHTLTLPSPFSSFFLRHSRPLFKFLPLVGIAGWDQSVHRHPRRARAHGEELDDALPTPPYNLSNSFWTMPLTDAVRNVPGWFAFTQLDILQVAAAMRLQTLKYYTRWRTQVWQCHLMRAQARRRLVFRL